MSIQAASRLREREEGVVAEVDLIDALHSSSCVLQAPVALDLHRGFARPACSASKL